MSTFISFLILPVACKRRTDVLFSTVCSTFHHNQDGTDSYHNILCGYAWHRTPEPDSPSEAEDTAAPEVEPGDAHGPEQPAGPSTSPDRVKLEEGHDDDTDLQSDQKPIKTEDDMKVEDQKIKLEVIDEDIKQEQPTVAFDVDPAVGPAPGSNASESGSGVDGGGVKRNKRHSARLNPTVSKSIDPETMRVTRSVTTTMSKGSH